MATHFDLVILGAGPGGYVAAVRAAQLGVKVAIVEEKYWGGVCLNVGCVPAKTLLRNAELAHIFTHDATTFGMRGDVSFDYGVAVDRSRKVSGGRSKGVHYLMKKNGVTEFEGRGSYRDATTLDVALSRGGTETLTFDNTIIATGASARSLPGVATSENVVTYETLILERDLPSSMVIVGAGAIGIEFAYLLRSYGVDVTVIEYLDRALPNEDIEVSVELEKQFKKIGVPILTSARVDTIADTGTSVDVTYTDKSGASSALSADKLLLSVGFAANVTDYGLENTGVALTSGGAIDVDDHLRTSVAGIYAIGDVTAKLQLAHVAEAQGIVAAETIGGADTVPLGDYRMMPRATFCQPQVASFGLTEQQARDGGHDVVVAKFPFVANAKAHALGDSSGFVKLVSDASNGELLGGHMLGHDVSELLPQLTLAQRWKLTTDQLARNVHTHPTLSEAMQDAFHGLSGHMINM